MYNRGNIGNCHRSRRFGFCQRSIYGTWSIIYRTIEMHDAILSARGQNVPIWRARTGEESTMQRDSLSKSLPRIIPRKERFALLIEIEIITSARPVHRGERWKGPIIPSPGKTTMLRSYECLVIGIAGEDHHPRSSPERSNLSRALEANNKDHLESIALSSLDIYIYIYRFRFVNLSIFSRGSGGTELRPDLSVSPYLQLVVCEWL